MKILPKGWETEGLGVMGGAVASLNEEVIPPGASAASAPSPDFTMSTLCRPHYVTPSLPCEGKQLAGMGTMCIDKQWFRIYHSRPGGKGATCDPELVSPYNYQEEKGTMTLIPYTQFSRSH